MTEAMTPDRREDGLAKVMAEAWWQSNVLSSKDQAGERLAAEARAWFRERLESLDVLRVCGDHIYHHKRCPHCTNNSAVIDGVIAVLTEKMEGKA